jgi:hypothetical protein
MPGDEDKIDIEVKLNEDDPPEPIVDGIIDLGAVTLEFLALALDPYPRKPGVSFDAGPAEPEHRIALRRACQAETRRMRRAEPSRLAAPSMDDKPSQALRRWPLQILDVALDRGGEDRRGRRHDLGRQYRRADGDVEILPAHDGHIDRPAIAASGRLCAARASCSMSAPRSAPMPAADRSRPDGRGHGARRLRSRPADGRPAQCRRRGDQGRKRRSRKPGACCARQPAASEYHGFVEGDDLGKGTVDVVVTEGFTGNIALKTAEGTAKPDRRISARGDEPFADGQDRLSLRQGAFAALRDKMDPRKVNGGVFLGLERHRHQEPWRHRCRSASPARSKSAMTWLART